MARNLTSKQQAFVDAILAGNNQSDAYRQAYDAENMLPETIHNRAYELMQDGEIAGSIEQGRQASQAQSVVSRDKVLEELGKVAFAPVLGEVRSADKVSALDKYAKVAGFYVEPDRGADRHPINITHVTVVLSHGKQETRELGPRDAGELPIYKEAVVEGEAKVLEEG